jgi:hypothetical protein
MCALVYQVLSSLLCFLVKLCRPMHFLFLMRTTCPAQLILPDLIALTI